MRQRGQNMSALAINYDKDFDVLYVRPYTKESVYGDEDDFGVVTLRRMDDDSVAGMIVYDFKQQCGDGTLDLHCLPIPIDASIPEIQKILHP